MYPLVEIAEMIGKAGAIDVETKALLLECNIRTKPFSPEVLADLPELASILF
jgi:exoribonuclease R